VNAQHGIESRLEFPFGNIILYELPNTLYNSRTVIPNVSHLRYTPQQIGNLIKSTRKGLGVTQKDLALTSGTGLRFVIDLEKGKETCEIGKALTVLQTLGIKLTLTPPVAASKE